MRRELFRASVEVSSQTIDLGLGRYLAGEEEPQKTLHERFTITSRAFVSWQNFLPSRRDSEQRFM